MSDRRFARNLEITIKLFQRLTLALFVLWVDANYPHDALAVDNLALVTHLLNRRTDFHFDNPQIFSAGNAWLLFIAVEIQAKT